jgi:hypothetical protein
MSAERHVAFLTCQEIDRGGGVKVAGENCWTPRPTEKTKLTFPHFLLAGSKKR